MKKIFLIFAITVSSFISLFSQDIISLKSGEQMQVTITKISMSEIEFRAFGSKVDALTVKLDKYLVESYTLAGQPSISIDKIEKMTSLKSQDLYDTSHPYIIKTNPLLFIIQSYKIGLEKSIKYNQSLEGELNVITNNEDEMYFNVNVRLKTFSRAKSLRMTDMGRSTLEGIYFAPTVSIGSSKNTNFSIYSRDENDFGNSRNNFLYGGMDLGYQLIFNRFALDMFAGLGLSINDDNEDYSFNGSHTSLGKIGVRSGIRIGYNF